MINLDTLDFAKGNGLVTVITQDTFTAEVLMVAYADREAVEKTLATGLMHYRSRSRGLWKKGETSGATQRVVELFTDCDNDSILARVVPTAGACHTGATSCFDAGAPRESPIHTLDRTLAVRARESATASEPTYTQRLLANRNLRLKKIGEESAELVAACADGDRTRAVEECADLFVHALVALRALGASFDHVERELAKRSRP